MAACGPGACVLEAVGRVRAQGCRRARRMRARGGAVGRAQGGRESRRMRASGASATSDHGGGGGGAGQVGRAAAAAPPLHAEAREPRSPGRARGCVQVMAPLPTGSPRVVVRALGAA